MNIENEIKAKVFAQYLGKQVIAKARNGNKPSEMTCGDLENILFDRQYNYQLVLKPINEISEMQMYKLLEIAIKSIYDFVPDMQHEFFGSNGAEVGLKVKDRENEDKIGFSFDGNSFELSINGNKMIINQPHLIFEVMKMGIDLPIVNGKTLHESGLATYK